MDGIIRQIKETGTKPECKFVTNENSKILISGAYLGDVTLEGYLKVGDLEVHSTSEGFGKLLFGSSLSEIYGDVKLFDYSSLEIKPNTNVTLQPGTRIYLEGDKDLEIASGTKIIMNYNSSILSENKQNSRKIKIKSGGTLKVSKDALVKINVPIIIENGGKLILEEHTLAYLDKITIEEGGILATEETSSICLLNKETIIMPYSEVVEENGSKVNKVKSGVVEINPGVTLFIDNGNDVNKAEHPIAIVGGIDLKGIKEDFPSGNQKYGILSIKKWSKLDIGRINSTNFTSILIAKGSDISFLTNNCDNTSNQLTFANGEVNNKINGNLTIGGYLTNGETGDPITKIQGFKSNRIYSKPLYYTNNEKVLNGDNKYVTVKFEIKRSDLSSYSPNESEKLLKLKNINFENVNFYCENVYYQEIIEDCNFKKDGIKMKSIYTDNNLINNLNGDNYTISEYYLDKTFVNQSIFAAKLINSYPNSFNTVPINYKNLNFKNCSFTNSLYTQDWLKYNIGSNVHFDNVYHFSGIYAVGFNKVIVENTNPVNKFINLNFGIYTTNCNTVEILGNIFEQCKNGNTDFNSTVKVCNNTFLNTQIGSSLNNSKLWKSQNNSFTNVYTGFQNRTNSVEIYTNNTLKNHNYGIDIQNGRAYLTDVRDYKYFENKGNEFERGRNKFEYDLSNQTPFIGNKNDIYFSDESGIGEAILSCGYNDMSAESNNHLSMNPLITSNTKTIDAVLLNHNKYNKIDLTFDIKTSSNIIINGIVPDKNTSQVTNPDCNDENIIDKCSASIVTFCSYFTRNDGNMAEYSGDSIFFDSYFEQALNDFCNGSLSCECMEYQLMDALQFATLGDSTTEKLSMIKNCLEQKLSSNFSGNGALCDRNQWRLRLGEIYERLNLLDSAISIYTFLLDQNIPKSDSCLANWRLNDLMAEKSDSTKGFIYDSLMNINSFNVLAELTRKYEIDTTQNHFAKQIQVDENNKILTDKTEITNISPNPFSNETVVTYKVAEEGTIRVVLIDIRGNNVLEIGNQNMKIGEYKATINGKDLVSGTYFVVLYLNDEKISQKQTMIYK